MFPADKVLDDDAAVAAKPFAGPYSICQLRQEQPRQLHGQRRIQGDPRRAEDHVGHAEVLPSSDNLKLDMQNKAIDVAWRAVAHRHRRLGAVRRLTVHEGPGGELRYIVFNMNTMPGDTPSRSWPIRKAIASSVDREALSEIVYKGTYTPAYSLCRGLEGANEAFKRLRETPDQERPRSTSLTQACPRRSRSTCSTTRITTGRFVGGVRRDQGPARSTGLFRVNLQSTEWVTYTAQRVKDSYPLYQLGWFPDFPDADNYLTPFFAPDNFLQTTSRTRHHQLIDPSAPTADEDARCRSSTRSRIEIAENHLHPAVVDGQADRGGEERDQGVDEMLDKSFKFQFTPCRGRQKAGRHGHP